MSERSRAAARCFGVVWLCGAVIAPLGDHFHVARGVTQYLSGFGPIWLGYSPLWFTLLVAGFMATLAVVQGTLFRRHGPGPAPQGWVFASPVVVLALYLTTSFYPWREGGTLELCITLAALAMYLSLDRTRVGLGVGVLVAIGTTAVEWALAQMQVFRYLPQSDELLGVAPWLLPLYFTASVAVGAIGRRLMVDGQLSS